MNFDLPQLGLYDKFITYAYAVTTVVTYVAGFGNLPSIDNVVCVWYLNVSFRSQYFSEGPTLITSF